ncbi:MAG: nuclear transport factor 2 family protein [Alphaproteobacteria bacterium]|nr:MAG: nuclear transport factor 2 family protein [Alphaproteobacteria bacterium]
MNQQPPAVDQLAARVRMLEDKEQIRTLCHLYCRALDRADETLLRSVFHPDSTHSHGPFKGPSTDFCGFAMAVIRALDGTQHHLSNVTIDVDGDAAFGESYFLAYHRVPKGLAADGVLAQHDSAIDEDLFIGGRYIDRYERRSGVWKIAHRTGVHDWEYWTAADARHFPLMGPDETGRRGPDDPVYALREKYFRMRTKD